jgi:hypothetical protein
MRVRIIVLAAMLTCLAVHPAMADCKEQAHELRQDMNKNRSDYKKDALAEARKELAAADLTLLKPLECREHLRKARRALRQGKK